MIPSAHQYKNTVGQVVGREENAFIVKTANTVVKVTDYESAARIYAGNRLG